MSKLFIYFLVVALSFSVLSCSRDSIVEPLNVEKSLSPDSLLWATDFTTYVSGDSLRPTPQSSIQKNSYPAVDGHIWNSGTPQGFENTSNDCAFPLKIWGVTQVILEGNFYAMKDRVILQFGALGSDNVLKYNAGNDQFKLNNRICYHTFSGGVYTIDLPYVITTNAVLGRNGLQGYWKRLELLNEAHPNIIK